MNNRNPILAVLFILSALILSACGQAAAKASDEWKQFVNEKYGYSIMVPSDCLIGKMPTYCKAKPPEERPQECMCFLDGENPDQVGFNAFTGKSEDLTLASLSIAHYDSPMFNPPTGVNLVEWLQKSFAERGLEIPAGPNMTLGGLPAIRIDTPASPQAYSYAEIYFLREDLLFQISMGDVDNEHNYTLYEKLLSTIEFIE